MTQKIISELKSNEIPREVPKIIDDIINTDTNKLRIFTANVQYANNIKFKSISSNANKYDIIFIIEPWRNLPEINGFEKYIYPNKYYNTLYIRKSINTQTDINGFGLTVKFKNKTINFMYIPPGNSYTQLPNGITIGDINWKANKLPEPLYHERSKQNRTGMSVINTEETPEFNDFPSDHESIYIELNIKYEKEKILDKHAVPRALYEACKTGIYRKPQKTVNLYSRIKYYSTAYWLIKKKKPKHSKLFNNNIFGEMGTKFWQNLYKHDRNKRTNEYKTKIIYEINKIRSIARDNNGLNVNIIYNFIKYNPKLKENILNAIKSDHLINALILKKREFKLDEFNPKDIRIIAILPTYLKIAEQNINLNPKDIKIRPNFIGFMPGQSVHSFIALLNLNSI